MLEKELANNPGMNGYALQLCGIIDEAELLEILSEHDKHNNNDTPSNKKKIKLSKSTLANVCSFQARPKEGIRNTDSYHEGIQAERDSKVAVITGNGKIVVKYV